MPEHAQQPPKKSRRRLLLRLAAVLAALVALSWLAAWLAQRSLRTQAKKRAMQSWLDENLNADVSLLGEMTVRLNILRDSRLLFHDVEIEHPNPVFPGKFATVQRMGAWVPAWAMLGAAPGEAEFRVQGLRLGLAEGTDGEWSTDGLLRPLMAANAPFPFPIPKLSGWKASLADSTLSVLRRDHELTLDLTAELLSRPDAGGVGLLAGKLPFSFKSASSPAALSGTVEPVELLFAPAVDNENPFLLPVAGQCELRVERLPLASLPFFFPGLPLENPDGLFTGDLRFDASDAAAGNLVLDGRLSDAPLAIFGLPRNAPLRLSLPISPNAPGQTAELRMGPSGFGAFSLTVPLDAAGQPERLLMRGEVALLDDIPRYFASSEASWPAWLSRAFPAVEWRSGEWRGFGWTGENLTLSLTRGIGGMSLLGEGDLLGGRVRVAVTPDQTGSPVTLSAERLDATRMAARFNQSFPPPFRAALSGSRMNVTWRGFPAGDGTFDRWGAMMVFAKPVIDLAASGRWWSGFKNAARAVIDELPGWGGGDAEHLIKMTGVNSIELEQISVIVERRRGGRLVAEFRALGPDAGLITGLVERRVDGTVEGEVLMSGSSAIIRATRAANPAFASALTMLANGASGMRMHFRADAGGDVAFSFPFISDARRLRAERERLRDGG